MISIVLIHTFSLYDYLQITKKPWYLGEDSGPTLDHQASTAADSKGALSLSQANHLLEIQRSKIKQLVKSKKFKVGMSTIISINISNAIIAITIFYFFLIIL